MAKHKVKFNKQKCKKCIYGGRMPHVTGIGGNSINSYICDYVSITGHTSLYRDGAEVKDRRGNDYDNCLMFKSKEGN